jgi:tetratricopeptide (TPR) repeat protein|tara:strand:+ start:542 stop:1009 length:468 start_codon:yes stop_codon:yes gene_type:complete
MAWWQRFFNNSRDKDRTPYYEEGLALVGEDKLHEALTSFRLALKQSPGDTIVLQQIAIVYTKIGMIEEAVKTYKHVVNKDPQTAGAHYGLAFLLVRTGKDLEAIPHLRAFLENAPAGKEAAEHVSHARETLARLTGEEDHIDSPPSSGTIQDELF